ncbi:cytochrome P450 [Xylaria sp. CBS 124048]|nr:cytochrome P450 [Xylaria sp. CBS 124048]
MASTSESPGVIPEPSTPGSVASKVLMSLIVLYLISYPIYALCLHPLSTYPGGTLGTLTRIPYWIASQHQKYGPTIRFAPNDVSYTSAQAWKDICLIPKGKKENGKEVRFHAPSANGTPNLITEPDPANLMVDRCRQGGDVAVNLTELFDWTTFDIMAEFVFGEALGLFERGEYSDWVATLFNALIVLPVILEPKSIAKMRLDHFNHTVTRVDKRLREGSNKPDLWNLVEGSGILTPGEIYTNAELFMLASTETTSSLLTGTTYYLLKNPDKMKILTGEIRGRFESDEEITFEALAQLEYLNACIREGLRVYPPIPSAIPREIAEGGNVTMGKWLLGVTRVSVHHTATYRSSMSFKNPDEFVPERWLGDPAYKDDIREAHQPFSVGTRNCLGMNMARHEMRLLLSKLVYHFDLKSEADASWRDQNVFVIWERKSFPVTFVDANTTAQRLGQDGCELAK